MALRCWLGVMCDYCDAFTQRLAFACCRLPCFNYICPCCEVEKCMYWRCKCESCNPELDEDFEVGKNRPVSEQPDLKFKTPTGRLYTYEDLDRQCDVCIGYLFCVPCYKFVRNKCLENGHCTTCLTSDCCSSNQKSEDSDLHENVQGVYRKNPRVLRKTNDSSLYPKPITGSARLVINDETDDFYIDESGRKVSLNFQRHSRSTACSEEEINSGEQKMTPYERSAREDGFVQQKLHAQVMTHQPQSNNIESEKTVQSSASGNNFQNTEFLSSLPVRKESLDDSLYTSSYFSDSDDGGNFSFNIKHRVQSSSSESLDSKLRAASKFADNRHRKKIKVAVSMDSDEFRNVVCNSTSDSENEFPPPVKSVRKKAKDESLGMRVSYTDECPNGIKIVVTDFDPGKKRSDSFSDSEYVITNKSMVDSENNKTREITDTRSRETTDESGESDPSMARSDYEGDYDCSTGLNTSEEYEIVKKPEVSVIFPEEKENVRISGYRQTPV